MSKKKYLWLSFLLFLLEGNMSMALTLTSPAFKNNELIPERYTCDGQDISPPLIWKETPNKTKSFALIMDDPDSPTGTWDHWILYNLPSQPSFLEENFSTSGNAIFGKNSWGKLSYTGPCPPSGTHHYIFTLYALDTQFENVPIMNKKELLAKIANHILEKSVLVGRYAKKIKHDDT